MDPTEARYTRRRRIVELLGAGEMGFEELRREMETTARLLEDDLRHVERSLRRGPSRLVCEPPCCRECGFAFRDRAPHRFQPPGKCPRCRSERISEPRLRVL